METSTTQRRVKVFLVEDSAPVCERLIEMIETEGPHEVVGSAATEEEAVAGITALRPEVGIFDINLARGSGIEALAEAKRRVPDLVDIVLSNFTTPQHRKASADAGARFFLDKSADFEQINDILSSLSKSNH
ncbi:MAG: response regulator [Burkholderiales bacterium]